MSDRETQNTYRVVRFSQNSDRRRAIRTGLTRADAQKVCSSPEVSSRTAKGLAATGFGDLRKKGDSYGH